MTDWSKLKVVDLKAELKKRGLAQTGLKPVLVARLEAAEQEDGSESEATIQDDANKLDTNSATSPDTVSPTVPISELNADLPANTALQATTEHSEPPTTSRSTPRDTSVIDFQSDPLPTLPTRTVESSQALAQNDTHESALPSVEPQEAIEDRQKRKRRSQSPPPSTADSVRKRFRTDEDGEGIGALATTHEDAEWIEKNVGMDEEVNAAAKEVTLGGVESGLTNVDDSKDELKTDDVQMGGIEPQLEDRMEIDAAPKRESATFDDDSPSKTRDSRQFKNLFSGEAQSTTMVIARSHDSSEEAEPDRVIDPATHPATSALYIRDIMRPLNPNQLKSHLATLAAPPGQEADLDVIVNFYIDTIRTHAFVSFINTSAASRVRSALHDRIWPDEKTRKPLWVDFIPLEKLDEWIEREQAEGGGRGSAKKWEVFYDVDDDRHVTTTLQEASSIRPTQHVRRPSVPVPPAQAPQAPRRLEPPSAPRLFNIRGQRAPMAKLDQLFKSTTAKPMLYYQPVPKELVNRRLDNIDAAMSKDAAAGKRMTGPINRYTFEDGDKLVDRGPEIFPGIRPPPDQRRGGGGRGGPPRDRDGGYRGRGGGGYGDRPPHRGYESFRPGMDPRDDRDRRY
jgi:SAP domain/RNSP1-SAP18 binding (RSB) motif